ncbi:hypothetical protein K431DRAFT_139164 [Polychaeton citri CBS 116435]|uniref:AMP-activated protein kinase glycogen-binding domain-containing protein n=1 Tax=Polychaeton citri CBS 116435 TaxID=1314669 RepID=A0A9P4Q555_9PEZI|nr:hypothetical protein K431DRAFT_139164 [Polychaeton citri CBS 116435]
MAQKVNITYSSPGLQPPVFLTTSLTHPQWEPVEMGVTTDADGNHVFSKEFEATEGHYQYKFRLGVGDWWVFDEGKPTVDDGFGNKNNLLVVEQPSSKAEEKTELPTTAPLLQREANADPEKNASEEVPVRTDPDLEPSKSTNSQEAEEEDAPLLKHEMAPTEDGKDRPQQTSLLSTPDLSRLSDKSQPDEVVAPEPSQADRAALEKFPEDHNGIMESIHKVSSNAPVDQVSDQPEEAVSRSRALSSASSSLPSVKEHDIEETVPEPEPAHPAVVSETSNPTVPEDSKASRPAEPITPPMTPKDENRPHAPASELENMGEEGPYRTRKRQKEGPPRSIPRSVPRCGSLVLWTMWW